MARITKKLSALEVRRINSPGKHPVGDSLYLQISEKGNRSWLFRFYKDKKATSMGLGSTKLISLAEARIKVADLQKDIHNGQNPLLKKRAEAKEQQRQEAKRITFDECAKKYIEAHILEWKNAKHRKQWPSTLNTYASPIIGHLPVQDIDVDLILKVLKPIWWEKTETASRLRGRIESVLSWAAVSGFRSHENPARWKGLLKQLLPEPSKIKNEEHFKALPFSEMSSFMAKLRTLNEVASKALEFTILTATRTNETLGAKWVEFNLEEKYWLIPKERMKAKKEHKVPLSARALEILKEMHAVSGSEYVFPGRKIGKPLSDMALLMVLRRMDLDVTTHGFRSSFSDWAAERTNFPRDVVEMALGHAIKNKVEAAYRRGDLFFKRQALMNEWANYCSSASTEAKLISLPVSF